MDVARAFHDRGIRVAGPATSEAVAKLRAVASPEIFSLLHENIYRYFDGFADDDFDAESFLRIWPIEAIAASELLTETFVPFMDVALHSDCYGLADGCGPTIFSRFMNARTTVPIDGLVHRIVDGDFDDSMGLPTEPRKRNVKRLILIGTLATLIAAGAFVLASPLTRLGLLGSEGHVEKGRFLDIEVGEPAARAQDKLLRRGFRLLETADGGQCMGVRRPASIRVALYFDDSWRRGTICVGSREGRVVTIDWLYGFLFP